jgi:amino acid transporter
LSAFCRLADPAGLYSGAIAAHIVSAAALAPMLPGVPGWLWIVGFIAINSLINLRGITFTARANNTILIARSWCCQCSSCWG